MAYWDPWDAHRLCLEHSTISHPADLHVILLVAHDACVLAEDVHPLGCSVGHRRRIGG